MTKVLNLQQSTRLDLSSVWYVSEGTSVLARGPIFSSKEETSSWLDFIKSFPGGKKRWVALQLAMPDVEWPIITSEHFFLSGTWLPHLVMTAPRLSPFRKEEMRNDLQWKTINKFVQQINCEGWLFYSEWMDDEMDNALSKFFKDATEQFEVEARLKDFHHEITSFLLKDYRSNCAKLVMQLGLGANGDTQSQQKDFELEIEIVRMHFAILRNLAIQRDVLLQIEASINKIVGMHPELIPLGQAVHLLATLIGPPGQWVQTLIYLGLLNHLLGVNVYLHCESGYDRTNLGFAVLLALKDLLRRYSVDELILFAEHYREPSHISHQFRELVWGCMSEVCLPLTHSHANWEQWAPGRPQVEAFLDCA